MINSLSNSMVARLKATMPTWDVDHFPSAPERYPWAQAKATILVVWDASTYGEPQSLDPMSVQRELDMSVTVLARSLRGDLSTTSALDTVRKYLFGWRPVDEHGTPLGFGRLRPLRESFVSEEQGVWRFVAIYRSAVLCVEDTVSLSGVPLTRATFKDPT